MLLTPHTAIGIITASKIKNPLISLPLAFVSHFLADSLIPHWNPSIYTEIKKNKTISRKSFCFILVDFLLSLLLAAYLGSKSLPDIQRAVVIFAGGMTAILPDSFEIPFYFLGSRHPWLLKYVNFHHRLQINVSFFPGMATQLALIALCLAFF